MPLNTSRPNCAYGSMIQVEPSRGLSSQHLRAKGRLLSSITSKD